MEYIRDDKVKVLAPTENGNMIWDNVKAITKHPVINKDGSSTLLKVTTLSGRSLIATKAKGFMKSLLNWRKSSDAIGKGKLIHYPVTDGMYIYFRKHERDLVMVAVNNLDHAKYLEPDLYKDVIGGNKKAIEILSGNSYSLRKRISIDPKSAKIFQIQ